MKFPRRSIGVIAAGILVSGCGVERQADVDVGEVPSADPGSSRLAGLLGNRDSSDYARAREARSFRFPEDHGPHPEYRNEWWYVTGNLDADNAERFGFELTLFRFSLTPVPPESTSAWRTNQVYIGHLALTDVSGERFFVAERYSRGALGLAGATALPFGVWLEDWHIRSTGGDSGGDGFPWRLAAADEAFGIDLMLTPGKGPVLNGDQGLSRKSADPGNASYYYSMPRLAAGGQIRIGDRSIDVDGDAWLDREWSSSALASDQAGWDWFALQFGDNTELMFYQLRRTDGSRDPMSAGTYIDARGRATHLGAKDVELEVTDRWRSPRGGVYPSGWRLSVPGLGIDVVVDPALEDQELDTTVRYWEGTVDVRPAGPDGPPAGRGYVELTGYADESG